MGKAMARTTADRSRDRGLLVARRSTRRIAGGIEGAPAAVAGVIDRETDDGRGDLAPGTDATVRETGTEGAREVASGGTADATVDHPNRGPGLAVTGAAVCIKI